MEIDKKLINLISQINTLSFEDINMTKSILKADDYESSLKYLCFSIYEEKMFISKDTYELIKRISEDLNIEPWVYSNLEFLVM